MTTSALGKRQPMLGIVLPLLALSLCLPLLFLPFGPERVLKAAILGVWGMASLGLLYLVPQLGFPLMLLGGLVIRREVATGTQTGLNGAFIMAAVMFALWIIKRAVPGRNEDALRSRTTAPILCFLGASGLALLVGQYSWFPAEPAPFLAQLGGLGILVLSGGVFLVSAQFLQDARWLKGVTWLFLGLGSLHLVARLIPSMGSILRGLLPQDVIMGSMFWTWLVILSFGQALLNRDLGVVGRFLAAGVGLAAVYIGLDRASSWLSGWVPGLLAVGIMLVLRYPRLALISAPIATLGAIGLFPYYASVFSAGDNVYSYATRTAALESILPLLLRDPLFGLGPSNYYHYSMLFPIMGWYVKFNSHNNYIDLIAQVGIVGLLCFLWFVWSFGRTVWDLIRRPLSGFDEAFVYSVSGGFVATLAAAALGDWLFPFVYNTGFAGFRTSVLAWMSFGAVVAIEQRLKRRDARLSNDRGPGVGRV